MRNIKEFVLKHRAKKGIFGLDIDDKAIKCTLIQANDPAAWRYRYAIGELPRGVVENNQIISKNALAQNIKNVLKKSAISTKYCIFSLSQTLVNSHRIRLKTPITDKELEIAVCLAIEKQFLFPLDELYFDYESFSLCDDQGFCEVLIVVAKKNEIDKRIKALKEMNLIPIAIETNVQAMQRAFYFLYKENKNVILLNIGVSQLLLLPLGKVDADFCFSEDIPLFAESGIILKKIIQAIQIIFLRYPNIKFQSIFICGCDENIIHHTIEKLKGLYNLNIQQVANNLIEHGSTTEETTLFFPAFFLSFGLALRFFHYLYK